MKLSRSCQSQVGTCQAFTEVKQAVDLRTDTGLSDVGLGFGRVETALLALHYRHDSTVP